MRRLEPDEAACIEGCIEALDEAVISLAHYPPRALAEALAVHLQCLLATLHSEGQCTRADIRGRLDEIARDALGEISRLE